MARVSKEDRLRLADKLTDTVFSFDPWNGLFRDEMFDVNNRDLRSLEGCYQIIEGLCDMLEEAIE